MPTIHDVAVRAGVSASTVSHVLNNTRFVESDTKERVLQAVVALNYRPNALARSLRRRGTGLIALLVPDNANPFFADVARAIEDVGFANGYSVILCNSDTSAEKEATYIDTLLSKQVDAFILIATSSHPEHLQPILQAEVPVVVVDRELGDMPVDQVFVDNRLGGYLAGQHLVRLGHRRIACITGQGDVSVSNQRLLGFRQALAAAGVDLRAGAVIAGDFRYPSGALAAEQILANEPETTAIFAANDLMAIGALHALRRLQRSVPDDISLIGFDDIDQASMALPQLTTIAQPMAELGRTSALMAIRRAKERTHPPTRVVLQPRLVERETCREIVRLA